MTITTQLTGAQIQALFGFAASRGRNWKSALRQAWETGNYLSFEQSNDLQSIRNQFGPSWLMNVSLKKLEASLNANHATVDSAAARPVVCVAGIITYDAATDDMTCSCGNRSGTDGFVACDEHGNECEPTGEWDGRYICQSCGATIRV